MKLFYNGTDIFNDVSICYCVHEMYAEKQADTLTLRFNDTKGLWSIWDPQKGDTLQFTEGAADTGEMYLFSSKPENGVFTVRAMSMPLSGLTKSSKSWEAVRFLQLGREVASNHGLEFSSYGAADQVYSYISQRNETDFGFYSRLCTHEGCQMILYDGRMIIYSERDIEQGSVSGSLEIGERGNFSYSDDRNKIYGSCEVVSGSCSGLYTADSSAPVYRPQGIHAVSDAEANRFAKNLLRNANKYARTGQFTRSLKTEYAACSLLWLKTDKAITWDAPVFVYKVRNDYMMNQTTIYFRDILEGY